MDLVQKRAITRDYPYPLIIEFQRLNTQEFKEQDKKRIDKIFDVLQLILQFLSLVMLSDLMEHHPKKNLKIPDGFRDNFKARFTRITLGEWKNLLWDLLMIGKANKIELYIPELYEYIMTDKGEPSEAMASIQELNHMRNDYSGGHGDLLYLNKSEMMDICIKAEELLDTILLNLDFIRNYQLLHVSNVTVNLHRWSNPLYSVDYASIMGNNPELFGVYTEKIGNLVHSPTLIINKKDENRYLNLEPLILYSEEGSRKIPDVFMYLDLNKDIIKYRPIFKGGSFNLKMTRNCEVLVPELLEFFKVFGAEESYLKLKNQLSTEIPNLIEL